MIGHVRRINLEKCKWVLKVKTFLLNVKQNICNITVVEYLQYRVVPDIRLAGYPAFFITGIRPDIRFHSPDIRLEKLFEIKNSFD